MALELVWQQADVDLLKTAISSGVLSVSYSGPPARTVQYQSIAEMREALKEILAQSAASDGRSTFKLAAHRKGL